MRKRALEEKMEAIRKEMEDVARMWGLGHPEVYELSQELDVLHNLWEKECAKKKAEKIYHIHPNASKVRERGMTLFYNVG
jgi:hypothetical protein